MSSFLENLGLGALFAAVGLPMLAAAVGDVSAKDPRSRHGVLLWPLILAASLFAVPWLREALRFGGEVAVAPAVLSQFTAPQTSGPAEASAWSAAAVIGALFLGLVCAAGLRLSLTPKTLTTKLPRSRPMPRFRALNTLVFRRCGRRV